MSEKKLKKPLQSLLLADDIDTWYSALDGSKKILYAKDIEIMKKDYVFWLVQKQVYLLE